MYMLFGPLAVIRRVLWKKICLSFCPSFRLSFCPSVCPSILLSVRPFFSIFWHGARNPYEVVHDRTRFSREIKENGPKMVQKQGLLNLLKNLVINFYWIFSIMEICMICNVPAQISWLGKILFLRYWPVRLQDFLIDHISRTNQWNSLIFWMLIQIPIN